jgi:hypothetical protein
MKTILIGLIALITLSASGTFAQARRGGEHGGYAPPHTAPRGGYGQGAYPQGGYAPRGYAEGGFGGPTPRRAYPGPGYPAPAYRAPAYPGPGYRGAGYRGQTFPGAAYPAFGGGPERSFTRGQFLPPGFGGGVVDPRRYHLRRPPNGYGWVTVGPNAYLTQRSTGLILDTAPLY